MKRFYPLISTPNQSANPQPEATPQTEETPQTETTPQNGPSISTQASNNLAYQVANANHH